MLARTQHTFGTLNILPKYNGHLFNWYDTVSLDPLMPKYISTVDNGNFVGHLMTLKQGFLEILDQKTFDEKIKCKYKAVVIKKCCRTKINLETIL